MNNYPAQKKQEEQIVECKVVFSYPWGIASIKIRNKKGQVIFKIT